MKNSITTPKWVILSDLVKFWTISWSCKNLRLPHIFLISEVNSCPVLMKVRPLISKLRTSSTRIWSHLAIRWPIRYPKEQKSWQIVPMFVIFRHICVIFAGSLESVYWLLRGAYSFLGNGGGEPLALLW